MQATIDQNLLILVPPLILWQPHPLFRRIGEEVDEKRGNTWLKIFSFLLDSSNNAQGPEFAFTRTAYSDSYGTW